ncbi:MAG TPA: hypothetical protein VHL09_14125, partial [Dehalococcoidia bacterium]|nr:hypothetical protein [Dehalococcoidia bacterium]
MLPQCCGGSTQLRRPRRPPERERYVSQPFEAGHAVSPITQGLSQSQALPEESLGSSKVALFQCHVTQLRECAGDHPRI